MSNQKFATVLYDLEQPTAGHTPLLAPAWVHAAVGTAIGSTNSSTAPTTTTATTTATTATTTTTGDDLVYVRRLFLLALVLSFC